MIAPQPFKYKCPKCGYNKIVKPKSDVIDLVEMLNICPKCKSEMDRVELGILEKTVEKILFIGKRS